MQKALLLFTDNEPLIFIQIFARLTRREFFKDWDKQVTMPSRSQAIQDIRSLVW